MLFYSMSLDKKKILICFMVILYPLYIYIIGQE